MLLLPSTPPSTSFVCDRENNHDFYCHVHIIHHYRKGIFNEIVNSGGITNIAAILILFRRKKTKKNIKQETLTVDPSRQPLYERTELTVLCVLKFIFITFLNEFFILFFTVYVYCQTLIIGTYDVILAGCASTIK